MREVNRLGYLENEFSLGVGILLGDGNDADVDVAEHALGTDGRTGPRDVFVATCGGR